MNYPGLFKRKYGKLTGRDWVRKIDPADKAVFVALGREALQYGHLGGLKRAQTAQRDARGRFARKDGTNKRTGTDPRAGTVNDERLWWD